MRTAVVLAAGAGTRLGELGLRYSKPMLPIAGRPLIDWVIARLRGARIQRFVVVGHPSDSALREFLRASYADVALVVQPERRGIADALRHALPRLADVPAYLACACDSLFVSDDIARLIARGEAEGGAAVIGVINMGPDATASRSAICVDGDRVTALVEKPAPGTAPSGYVAMPVYWLPQSIAPYVEVTPQPGSEGYISTALSAFIQNGGIVHAVRFYERLEITTADDVRRAEARLGSR